MTALILFPLIVSYFLSLLFIFKTFDRILRIQYQDYREVWVAEGRPNGFLWSPKEGNIITGSIARSERGVFWSLYCPQWAKSNSEAVVLFRKYKRLVVVHLCFLLLIVFVLSVSS